MAITFTRAETVAAGAVPTSTQWNKLAAAYNDRLRSGIGDGTWRLFYKYAFFTRNIRGDDAPVDEWLAHYMIAKAGEPTLDFTPENDANPLIAFVLGSATYGGLGDETRLNSVPVVGFTDAVTTWEQAKLQRGAIDPSTGAEASPALAAARALDGMINALMANAQDATSVFSRNYGGFMPSPPPNDFNCTGEPVPNDEPPPDFVPGPTAGLSYRLYFTNLHTGATTEWASNCKYDGTVDVVGSNLKSITVEDEAYVVTQWDDTVVRLPFADWIIGPFNETSRLTHPYTTALDEMLQGFASRFQFNFQKWLTTQYALAPAMGTQDGEDVVATYPVHGTDAVDAGEYFAAATSIPAGFVLWGVKVTISGIEATQTAYGNPHFQVRDEDNMIPLQIDITLRENGRFIIPTTAPKEISTLSVKSINGIASGTTVEVEMAVIEQRKPRLADAYLVLRLATTNGDGGSLDTVGPTGAEALTHIFTEGAIVNAAAVPIQSDMQFNPIYDMARRRLHDRLRLIKRPALKGYAVIDGKSVLWFDRMVDGFDAWDGMAPPIDSLGADVPVLSGAIRDGVKYRAGGSVTYNGVDYAEGDTFDGVVDVKEWTGTGPIYQHDGIIANAPRQGFSNQWLMFIGSNSYNDSEGSDLAPSTYGDVLCLLQQRCLFLSEDLISTDLCGHAAYGLCDPALLVQAPSANIYSLGLNVLTGASDADKIKFFSSCQVYPPDYELASVQYDSGTGEVRIELTGRLRTLEAGDIARVDAPASCAGQDYRTDENILRQYLYYHAGSGDCAALVGDAAELLSPAGAGGNGSCHPRFYFSRLVPTVSEDDNNVIQPHDTRMLAEEMQWLTGVLDAICEGYIDVQGSAAVTDCATPAAQYRYPNLMRQAGGAQSEGFLPDAVRSDRPQGFGPFAHTKLYAEQFNRLANAINLLTVAPLDLPWQFEHRTRTWTSLTPEGLTQHGALIAADPADDVWEHLSQAYGTVSGLNPEGTEATPGGWFDGAVLSASASALVASGGEGGDTCHHPGFLLAWTGSDYSMQVAASQVVFETRLKPAQLAFEALSPGVADLMSENFAVMGQISLTDEYFVSDAAGDEPPVCGAVIEQAWGNPETKTIYHNPNTTFCALIDIPADGTAVSLRDILHTYVNGGVAGPIPESFLASYNTTVTNVTCIAFCAFGPSRTVSFIGSQLTAVVTVPLV